MSDSYQPIYDAVRSRISNGDVGHAIESAISQMGIGHYADMAKHAVFEAAGEYTRPCVLFRPKLFQDGNMWCALYGENLQEGLAGFGDTPAKAMYDFDKEWNKSTTIPASGMTVKS